MRAKRMVGVAVGLLLLPFTTATQCDETPTAPRMGVIVKITPGSAACWDELSDAGPRQRVGVEYRPDGIDPSGFPWPARVACVTDAVAVGLVEGGRFEG
jgi:hypothetical protein